MSSNPPPKTRRITLALRMPRLALYRGVRPTVVFEAQGHPAQWGTGTWLVPSDRPTTLGVYLFNRVWRFGEAGIRLEPNQADELEYIAPMLPFLPGRLRTVEQPVPRRR